MSLPQNTPSNQYSGSSFNTNLLRSLTSVHLPPPPSARGYPVLSKGNNANVKTHGKSSSLDGSHNVNYSSVYNTPWSGGSSNGHGPVMSLELNDGSQSFESPLDTKGGNGSYYHKKLADITESALNTPPSSQQRDSSVSQFSAMQTIRTTRADPNINHREYQQDMYETPTLSGARSGRYKKDAEKENMFYYNGSTSNASNQHIYKGSTSAQFGKVVPPVYHSLELNQANILKVEEDEQDIIPEPEDMPKVVDDGKKPPYSYAALIGMAILRSSERKLTLSQIYQWINDTFEWYRKSASGWQNSIRHNLSLNKAFQKQERPKGDPGKGNYWLVVPGCEHQFVKQKPVRKSAITPSVKSQLQTKAVQVREQEAGHIYQQQNTSFRTTNMVTSSRNGAEDTPQLHIHNSQKGQSTDDDNNADAEEDDMSGSEDEEDDEENQAQGITRGKAQLSKGAAKRGRGTLNESELDDYLSTPFLLKRTKTAIGLQHFSTTNVNAISPIKNSGNTDLLLTMRNTPRKGSRASASPTSTPLNSVANKQQPSALPHHPRTSTSSASVLDPDGIPDLSAPSGAWLPYTTNDETLSTGVNASLDPTLVKFNGTVASQNQRHIISDSILSDLPSSLLMSPGSIASPSTSLRNHRAAVRSMTMPFHEYEDLLTSPSAGLGKRRSLIEEEDMISRACFGSPDKREARRRQYLESSGVSRFGLDDTLADVFGVDICQVVRRELKHSYSALSSALVSSVGSIATDTDTDTDKGKEQDRDEESRHSNGDIDDFRKVGYGLSLFDSPIKTEVNISPPKMSRRDSAYF